MSNPGAPFVDPFLRWDGPFPYRVLRPFGITPASRGREVLDLLYDLEPAEIADPVINQAWTTLHDTASRLVVDFACPTLVGAGPAQPLADLGAMPDALLDVLSASLPPPVRLRAPAVRLPETLPVDPASFAQEQT